MNEKLIDRITSLESLLLSVSEHDVVIEDKGKLTRARDYYAGKLKAYLEVLEDLRAVA